jgi:hypothetical protein
LSLMYLHEYEKRNAMPATVDPCGVLKIIKTA